MRDDSTPATLSLGPAPVTPPPPRLGRYRVVAQLGAGGFGVVYRGHDDELRRDVAIKVPHRHRVGNAAAVDAFLAEARTLATLDHPGIAPVHDVGRTEDGLCYVVSKFVEGIDLSERLAQGPLAPAQSAAIVAQAAEALHHAHQRGFIHRDVKPANILLDRHGRAVVADFGLARRETEIGTGTGYAGTPAYMSPEQAGGEGHRVDARSDIFSLGAVLYELLTGRRPFRGGSVSATLDQVRSTDPEPPRHIDHALPRELERICLKCLAKRAAARYRTALELADDLRHWLATDGSAGAGPGPVSCDRATPLPALLSSDRVVRVVPKGLRSFDAGDAAFFLELLPGPRDRDGLPESLRFWVSHIEQTDADETFPLGLLYGPSGCGKSSLVRAGLLPRLAAHVAVVYIEASAADTEARLLRGLRKQFPAVADNRNLVDGLAAVRRGLGPGPGRKLLLVVDQFEQWLHARSEGEAELVRALRQCDGGRVQALVLVRDDFWMAATQFMHDLELNIEARNSAAVSLFEPAHARKVLIAFGRAFATLPPSGDLGAEQSRFVDQAVAGLVQEGKVIPVRLALFAEMMKERPWTPASLRSVGGAAGVGVTFLEETFNGPGAAPEHRYHQRAARAVLGALLPEQGTDIKGQLRAQGELQARAGYASRPRDWQRLLAILDFELRLVTPTDVEGNDDSFGRDAQQSSASCLASAARPDESRYYQLTHDYLVPALREWLTRKQRETRRGRAELCLAERASAWSAKPENRHLPSLAEWARIRLLTRGRDWTAPQKQMMSRAARHYALRLSALVVLALVAGWAAWDGLSSMRAAALVRALAVAETADAPKLIQELGPYRRWAQPRLQEMAVAGDAKERLHAALALGQFDYLAERMVTVGPEEAVVIRDALAGHGVGMAKRFWEVLAEDPGDAGRRLRAASALAALDPRNSAWAQHAANVAGALVQENVLLAGKWAEALRPVGPELLESLSAVYRDRSRPEAQRTIALDVLADYAAGRVDVLAALLVDADVKGYAVLYPRLAAHGDRAVALLEKELERKAEFTWKDAPIDPAWNAGARSLIPWVECGAGLITERFALCQTLPLSEFASLVKQMRRCGYRPVRVRPYATSSQVRVAALWTRDGRDFQLDLDGRPGARREGYQPADVAGYLDHGAERAAMLWEKADAADEARCYALVPAERHQSDGWAPLRDGRLGPATLQMVLGTDGQPRYSSVWRASAAAGHSFWTDDEKAHAARPLASGLPIDVALWQERAGEKSAWTYGGCFLPSAGFDHVQLAGLSPAEHLRRCRQLAAEGYRPVAIAVADGDDFRAASVWHRPAVAEETKERLAQRQANALSALTRLGHPEHVWPLLQHRPDPRLRSYLIHHLGACGVDARMLAQRLTTEPDVSTRRALLLCLGEPGPGYLAAAERARLLPTVTGMYRDHPDAGLHAAAQWLLRQWGYDSVLGDIDRDLVARDGPAAASGVPADGRRWYVNGQGQTLALVRGPVEFVMGSPRSEQERLGGVKSDDEMQHPRRIGRSFALGTTEVSVGQFLKLRKAQSYSDAVAPTLEHPITMVTWYEAAEYCNLLSKAEGIPEDQWCFVPNDSGAYAPGMSMRPNYLSLSGYRLPTEAEWEYACRAGSVTKRYYGEGDALLSRYAWYITPSEDRGLLPAGTLRPNDFGLFDMLGNAYEWCADQAFDYVAVAPGAVLDDREQLLDFTNRLDKFIVRGGSFATRSMYVRAAYRGQYYRIGRSSSHGLRVARTIP